MEHLEEVFLLLDHVSVLLSRDPLRRGNNFKISRTLS